MGGRRKNFEDSLPFEVRKSKQILKLDIFLRHPLMLNQARNHELFSTSYLIDKSMICWFTISCREVGWLEHITGFGLFSDEFSWFPLWISCVWNLIQKQFCHIQMSKWERWLSWGLRLRSHKNTVESCEGCECVCVGCWNSDSGLFWMSWVGPSLS